MVYGSRKELDHFVQDYRMPQGATQSSQFENMKKSEFKNIVSEEIRVALIGEMDGNADEVLHHLRQIGDEDAQKMLWGAYEKGHLSAQAVIKIAKATGGSIEEEGPVDEVTSKKQQRWACAQINSKNRPEGLSKAEAEEMCKSKIKEEILKALNSQ